jgi:hypothetical protein
MIRRIRLSLIILCVALVSWPAFGDDETGGPVIEPRVQTVLTEAGRYLRDAQRFTFRMESTREIVLESGQKLQYTGTGDVAVRRPDGLQISSHGDLVNARLWYDGNRLTILNLIKNTYATIKVPPTVDEAFDLVAERYGISPPLIEIAYNSPAGTFLERVKTGFYVGLHEVRGVRCHHLAFTQDDLDWQMWIADGWRPELRKVVITYKKEPSFPQYIAYLSDWDFAPKVPDSLFTFLRPESAQFVQFEELRPADLPEESK